MGLSRPGPGEAPHSFSRRKARRCDSAERSSAAKWGCGVQVDPLLGGLANVVVYLQKAPAEAAPFHPERASLVQTRGRFEPHVQVVARESKVRLRTTDDTADFQFSGAASFARGLARGGPS